MSVAAKQGKQVAGGPARKQACDWHRHGVYHLRAHAARHDISIDNLVATVGVLECATICSARLHDTTVDACGEVALKLSELMGDQKVQGSDCGNRPFL